jgi:hypothetical protein
VSVLITLMLAAIILPLFRMRMIRRMAADESGRFMQQSFTLCWVMDVLDGKLDRGGTVRFDFHSPPFADRFKVAEAPRLKRGRLLRAFASPAVNRLQRSSSFS